MPTITAAGGVVLSLDQATFAPQGLLRHFADLGQYFRTLYFTGSFPPFMRGIGK